MPLPGMKPDSNRCSQTYPVSYTYDYAGRQQTMTTYGTEEATTTWIYSPTRGWLDRKQYDDGKGTDYTYTPAGRLLTRTWERGVLTSYTYDAGGRLTQTEYWTSTALYQDYLAALADYQAALANPQSTQKQIDDALQSVQDAAAAGAVANTPNVAVAYDSLGRQLTQTNSLATSTFTYNHDNLQIDTEEITYNLPGLATFTRLIDRTQDALGRDTGWTLGAPTSPGAPTSSSASEAQATYTYSGATGRLESVTKGSDTFTYGYEDDSLHLLATVTSRRCCSLASVIAE
jgi:YD repeat-containing protein